MAKSDQYNLELLGLKKMDEDGFIEKVDDELFRVTMNL